MMARRHLMSGLALVMLLAMPVAQADLAAGLEAAGRQDWTLARTEFEPLAVGGDTAAMVNLGNLYMKGLGVDQDYVEARRWYQQAAERGDRGGQGKLGLLHYFGLGVPIDYGLAAHWFLQAAEQGEQTAETILATLYARGEGVERDLAAAYVWYTRAMEQGYPGAEQARTELVETMSPGEVSEALSRLSAQAARNHPEPVPVAESTASRRKSPVRRQHSTRRQRVKSDPPHKRHGSRASGHTRPRSRH